MCSFSIGVREENIMSILKLTPAGKDYLWGGTRLITEYGKEFPWDKLAETWELSCHPDGQSIVAEGEFSGRTLSEYIKKKGVSVLGSKCKDMEQFPLLIKFIDAKEDLSIQVHPTDEYALKYEGQYGKTEAWYIIDAKPDAFIYHGFNRPIAKEEFIRRIEEKTLPEVLNKVKTKKGDVFFIPPGTIHAIGGGNLIAEIQQNSNVTYRVYDYGRVGADGKERELHVDKALAVTVCTPPQECPTTENHLISCNHFQVNKITLIGAQNKVTESADETSFVSLLVLSGNGTVTSKEDKIVLKKGDSIFIPAGTGEFQVEGELELLVTRV